MEKSHLYFSGVGFTFDDGSSSCLASPIRFSYDALTFNGTFDKACI